MSDGPITDPWKAMAELAQNAVGNAERQMTEAAESNAERAELLYHTAAVELASALKNVQQLETKARQDRRKPPHN